MNHRRMQFGAPHRRNPLDTLAHEIEAAYRAEATQSPLAIGVEGLHLDACTVSRTDLGVGHPADALVGLQAPPTWDAFGLLVSGTAYTEDPDLDDLAGVPGTGRATIGRVRLAYLIDRDGHEAGLTRFDDSTDRDDLCTAGPFEGRMVDACHRVLGLSTAPPTTEPAELWAVIWLCNVVDAARQTGPLSWADVARLHPAMAAAGLGFVAGDLVEVGEVFGRAWTWEGLRSSVAEGTIRFDDLAPFSAAWMDEGMFARWALHRLPVVAEMLEPLEQALPLEHVFTVLDVLDDWGLI